MAEVVVIASFRAQPGKEEEAERALRSAIEPTHAEGGCLLYALHQGAEDRRRFCFVERWASAEDLAAHGGAPHMQAVLPRLPELFGEDFEIIVYGALPGGDAAKGSLAGVAG